MNEATNEVERLLAAAVYDAAARPLFTAALLDSDVYVLGTLEGVVTDGVLSAGGTIRLPTAVHNAEVVIPFFSSPTTMQRLLAARPDTARQYIQMRCRTLFGLTRGSNLFINLESAASKLFVPHEIASLERGEEPGIHRPVLDTDVPVLLAAPSHIPPHLLDVLGRFFAQRPTVEAVHLGWIVRGGEAGAYLLAIVAADAEQATIGFGSLQIGDFTGGETLDLIVYSPGRPHLLSNIAPFYVRR